MTIEPTSINEILPEACLIRIFSFLGKGATPESVTPRIEGIARGSHHFPPSPYRLSGSYGTFQRANFWELQTMKDAAELQTQLAGVCQKWKNICYENQPMISGDLQAKALLSNNLLPDVVAVPSDLMSQMIKWLIRFRPSLGAIFLDYCTFEGVEVSSILDVLRKCDTSNVKSIFSLDHAAKFLDRSLERNQLNFGTVKEMMDTIAHECPLLEELVHFIPIKCLMIPQQAQELVSSPLFSLVNLQRLELVTVKHHSSDLALFDHTIYSKVIASLPRLEELELGLKGFMDLLYMPPLRIESETLEVLRLRFDICSVDVRCPRLRQFHSEFDWDSPFEIEAVVGSIPVIASEKEHRRLYRYLSGEHGDLILSAGTIPFLGLDVPPDCICHVDKFAEFLNEGFGVYMETIASTRQQPLPVPED